MEKNIDASHGPLVSIGLPIFNGASRMRRAIDSLLSQSHRSLELIISDDGSSDQTGDIAEEYARKDSRVRYIRQPKNQGQIWNIRFVLQRARGEYFMLAADDDWWHPQFIEKLLHAHQRGVFQCAMPSFKRIYEDGILRDEIYFRGESDLSNQTNLMMYRGVISNKPTHLLLYGLFRTEFLKKIFSRQPPRVIRWDRVIVSEIVLAGKCTTVEDTLFFKTESRKSVAERYGNQTVGGVYQEPFAYTRYVWMLLWRPITSRPIPFFRKLFVPIIWFKVFWMYKRKMAQEVVSRFLT